MGPLGSAFHRFNRLRAGLPLTIILRVRRRELISVQVRYYVDSQTDLPYIYNHDVSEMEVEQVLTRPAEDHLLNEGAHVAIGYTSTGRTLRVIYVPEPQADGVFVITAYDLRGKPLLAYRRRRRRKHQ